jgi:hypothetical protein
MATSVNRYTQVSNPRYNPRSLQELMIAPMYMREQHDNLLNTSAALETEIAKSDPLAVHSDAIAKEQARLYEGINKEVDMLNTEGFNPSSKSNFIKLNKEYQQSVSPTGLIGKANKAKEVLNVNKNMYLENAVKEGFSAEQALKNWAAFENEYIENYAKDQQIKEIEQMFAPKYYDYINEAQKLFTAAGVSSTDIGGSGGKIVPDDMGTYVVNSSHREINESNIAQLQAAADFMNNTINNPNSDAYKSIIHEGKTPESALQEIKGLGDVYIKSKYGRDSGSSISNFTPTIKDDSSRLPSYIEDVIQGIDIKNIDATSPLHMTETLKNAEFDEKGNIIASKGQYKTYQEKIKALKDSGKYSTLNPDQNTGLYKATLKAVGSPGPGANMSGTIAKDPYHYKSDLEKMRIDNPQLKGLSDKELIQRLTDYRASISSNYVKSLEIPGANYEWMNDRLFGNQAGTGEKSTGMFSSKGATIKGKEYSATEVIDQLGYKNIKELKELGQPTVRGYVTALGKWRAVVANSKGKHVDIFLNDISEFSEKTQLTQTMAKMSFEGKAFAPVGKTSDGQTIYFVNDFMSPKLVKSWSGITTASQIPPSDMDQARSFEEVSGQEKMGLLSDPLFQQLSNTKQK